MPESICFLCDRREVSKTAWSVESLKFIYEGYKQKKVPSLCIDHEDFCEKRIKEFKDEVVRKVVLKVGPKQFLPEIPKKPIKNYQDREPGEEG